MGFSDIKTNMLNNNSGGGGGKNSITTILVIIVIVIISAYAINSPSYSDNEDKEKTKESSSVITKESKFKSENSSEKSAEKPKGSTEESVESSKEVTKTTSSGSLSESEKEYELQHTPVVKYKLVPTFNGEDTELAINAGFSDFDIDSFFNGKSFKEGWVSFSDLDALDRVGKAKVFITPSDLTKTINSIDSSYSDTPIGFSSKEYLEKSQLIDSSFTKENVSVSKNIFTGTTYLNEKLMLKYENLIREAVGKGYSILLEVTPIYKNKELIPRGIQLRATSYGSDTLDFNVFLYNVNKSKEISYK